MSRTEPAVLNRHHLRGKAWPAHCVYIGRPGTLAQRLLRQHRGVLLDGTALGNRFTLAEHGEDALKLYRRWLWGEMGKRDSAARGVLEMLRPEHNLVCSCAPRPCHGDVVLAAWRWLHRGEEEQR